MGICGMNRMATNSKMIAVNSQNPPSKADSYMNARADSPGNNEAAKTVIPVQSRKQSVLRIQQFAQFNEASLEGASDKKAKDKKRGIKKFNFREQAKFEQSDMVENFKKVDRNLSSTDVNFIKSILKKCSAFNDLLEEDYEEIVPNMFFCQTKAGEYVFQQNDPATCFFIIHDGQCEVEINNNAKRHLEKGDMFGELALLYNAPRSASIKASTETSFWALDKYSFRAVVDRISSQNYDSNRNFLDKIKFFDPFSSQQKNDLASYVIIEKYLPGQAIVNKGDMANSYYVIKEGTVECWDDDKFIRDLQGGDAFGEQALYQSSTRALSVKAKTKTTCLVLSRDILTKVLGADIETIINKNTCLWAIERNEIFAQLSQIQKMKWINSCEIFKLSKQQGIADRQHMPWFLIIVLEGKIIYGEKVYEKGEIFGLEFLYPKANRQTILQHKLVAEQGKYAQISMKAFLEIVEGDLESSIRRNSEALHKKKDELTKNFRDEVANLNLEHLIFVKKLGEGQFGDVLLVSDPAGTNVYALKVVLKNKIVEHMIERHVVNEKKVLEELNFPFIMKLFKTFKDDKAVYFLTSFIRGMEMFDMIRQVDLLDNEETRFYIGTLILTLEYLHGAGIVYRDLKPENMIVDTKGYLNLIDFGTAKKLSNLRGRTQTIIGTPHYMAPETLQGKGYSYAVDVWSLGIIMYEFMCGCVPFGEEEVDPINIYNLIIKSHLEFPSYFVTPENREAMNLIHVLLNRIPEARVGGDWASLKSHNWFGDLDWDCLFSKEVEAPYIPPDNHIVSGEEIASRVVKKISAISEIDVG
jgi:cGMP-dependent protein kinase